MPIKKYMLNVDGKDRQVSEKNINQYGMGSYASSYPNATVRMRDDDGADYDIPIADYDKAVNSGLHPFITTYYDSNEKIDATQPSDSVAYMPQVEPAPAPVAEKPQVKEPTDTVSVKPQERVVTNAEKSAWEEYQRTGNGYDPVTNTSSGGTGTQAEADSIFDARRAEWQARQREKSGETKKVEDDTQGKKVEDDTEIRKDREPVPSAWKNMPDNSFAAQQEARQRELAEPVSEWQGAPSLYPETKGEALIKPEIERQQLVENIWNSELKEKVDALIKEGHEQGLSNLMQHQERVYGENAPWHGTQGYGFKAYQEYAKGADAKHVIDGVQEYLSSKQASSGAGGGEGEAAPDPMQERLMQKVYDYLVQQNTPKNTAEYILKTVFDTSITGQLLGLGNGKSYEQRQIEAQGLQQYDASGLEEVGAMAASIVSDLPVMAVTGGIGSAAGNTLLRGATNRLMASGMSEAAARAIATRAAQQGAMKWGLRTASEALNFGTLEATGSAVGQLYQTGEVDLGDVAQSFAKGTATGAIMGVFGVSNDNFRRMMEGAVGETAGRAIGYGTSLSGRTAILTGSSVMGQYLADPNFDIHNVDWTQELSHAALMNIGFDILGAAKRYQAERKTGIKMRDLEKLNLTKEDIAQLNRAGVNGKNAQEIAESIMQTKDAAELRKGAETGEGLVGNDWAAIEQELALNKEAGVMGELLGNPNIDLQTKAKVAYLMTGIKFNLSPSTNTSDVQEQADGSFVVEKYDPSGQVNETRRFTTREAAEKARYELQNEVKPNQVNVLEGMMNDAGKTASAIRIFEMVAKQFGKTKEQMTAEYVRGKNGEPLEGDARRAYEMLDNLLKSVVEVEDYHYSTEQLKRRMDEGYGEESGWMDRVLKKKYNSLTERERQAYDEYVSNMQLILQGENAQREGLGGGETASTTEGEFYPMLEGRQPEIVPGAGPVEGPAPTPSSPREVSRQAGAALYAEHDPAKMRQAVVREQVARERAVAAGVSEKTLEGLAKMDDAALEEATAAMDANTQRIVGDWIAQHELVDGLNTALDDAHAAEVEEARIKASSMATAGGYVRMVELGKYGDSNHTYGVIVSGVDGDGQLTDQKGLCIVVPLANSEGGFRDFNSFDMNNHITGTFKGQIIYEVETDAVLETLLKGYESDANLLEAPEVVPGQTVLIADMDGNTSSLHILAKGPGDSWIVQEDGMRNSMEISAEELAELTGNAERLPIMQEYAEMDAQYEQEQTAIRRQQEQQEKELKRQQERAERKAAEEAEAARIAAEMAKPINRLAKYPEGHPKAGQPDYESSKPEDVLAYFGEWMSPEETAKSVISFRKNLEEQVAAKEGELAKLIKENEGNDYFPDEAIKAKQYIDSKQQELNELKKSLGYWKKLERMAAGPSQEELQAIVNRSEAARKEQRSKAEGYKPSKEYTDMQKAYADSPDALDILNDLEPHTPEELAAGLLASGVRLMKSDETVGGAKLRGVMSMTGYCSRDLGRMNFIFATRANGGISVEEFGEMLESSAQEYGIRFDGKTTEEAVTALLNLLGEVEKMGDIIRYVENRRMEEATAMYDAENDAIEQMKEEAAWKEYGMSYADLQQLQDAITEATAERQRFYEEFKKSDAYNEFINTFAENNEYGIERNDDAGREGGNGTVVSNDAAAGQRPVERSDASAGSVLPLAEMGEGQQPVADLSRGTAEERGTDGNGDTAPLPDGPGAGEVEGRTAVSAEALAESRKLVDEAISTVGSEIQSRPINVVSTKEDIEALRQYQLGEEVIADLYGEFDNPNVFATFVPALNELFIWNNHVAERRPSKNELEAAIYHENVHSLMKGGRYSRDEFIALADAIRQAFPDIDEFVTNRYGKEPAGIQAEEVVSKYVQDLIESGMKKELLDGSLRVEGDTDFIAKEINEVINLIKDRTYERRTGSKDVVDRVRTESQDREGRVGRPSENGAAKSESVSSVGERGSDGNGEESGLAGRPGLHAEPSGAVQETGRKPGYTVEKRHHAQQNKDIWAVKFEERYDRDKFLELKDKAREFGGYYSRFGKGGFIFKNEEDARRFGESVVGVEQARQESVIDKEYDEQGRETIESQAGHSASQAAELGNQAEAGSLEDAPATGRGSGTSGNRPVASRSERPTQVNGYRLGEKVVYKGKEATIFDFENDGTPVLDTGMAPVIYEVGHWEDIQKLPVSSEQAISMAQARTPKKQLERAEQRQKREAPKREKQKQQMPDLFTQVDALDETLVRQEQEVDAQLALMAEYKAGPKAQVREDMHTGAAKTLEKAARKLAKSLANRLGGHVDGKDLTRGLTNIASIGGDMTIRVWMDDANTNGVLLNINFDAMPDTRDFDKLVTRNGYWRLISDKDTFGVRSSNHNFTVSNVDELESGAFLSKLADNMLSEINRFAGQNRNNEPTNEVLTLKEEKDGRRNQAENQGLGTETREETERAERGRDGGSVHGNNVPDAEGSRGISGSDGEQFTPIGDGPFGLLTAFEKEKPTATDRTTDIGDTKLQNDTAPLQTVSSSEDKDSELQNTIKRNTNNFSYGEAHLELPTGEIGKLKGNIEAIRTLKELEASGQPATAEQKQALLKFVGWGGLAEALNSAEYADWQRKLDGARRWGWDLSTISTPWSKKWGKHYEELRPLMTDEEWASAQASTLNSHYTPEIVIRGLWDALEYMGFRGGKIQEPAMGIGHMVGFMPKSMSERSVITGFELDGVPGRIAQQLYPDAIIHVAGYETQYKPNSQDAIVTNVPFGQTAPIDPALDKTLRRKIGGAYNLHNYFIVKGLLELKPGGVGAFITSAATMDGRNTKAREYIAGLGVDLIGAIRLPNTTFSKNAGTEVTAEILFFRKRLPGEPSNGVNFVSLSQVGTGTYKGKDKNGNDALLEVPLFVNEYFAQHPEMMLGTVMTAHDAGSGGLYGGDSQTLVARPGTELSAELADAIGRLPENSLAAKGTAESTSAPSLKEATTQKNGTLSVKNGKVYVADKGELTEVASGTFKHEGRTRSYADAATDYLALKETLKALIKAEQTQKEDPAALRKQLNDQYNDFVSKYGQLNENKALSPILEEDYERFLAQSLERVETIVNPKTGRRTKVVSKGDGILEKRVSQPMMEPEKADNLQDAIGISQSYRGRMDMDYIARMTGMTADEARERILQEHEAYEDPVTGDLIDRDAYLSGNIREKLETARTAAENDERFSQNVADLEAAMPETIPFVDISYKIGTPWIPETVYEEFAYDVLGIKNVKVRYIPAADEFVLTGGYVDDYTKSADYSTTARKVTDLFNDAVNLRKPTIYKQVDKDHRVKDEAATQEAVSRIMDMNDAFIRYIQEREDLHTRLQNIYNDRYNNYRLREYRAPNFKGTDGKVHYPGANPAITLRGHQVKAVQRSLQGSTLLAHQVGTGKTFTMITTAMEMRRLGLAKKPMIVVQNATLNDFAADFLKLYPGANILVPNETERSASQRKRLFNLIATGDFDAVIVPQSFLAFIPDDEGRKKAVIQARVDEIMAAAEALAVSDRRLADRLKREAKAMELALSNDEANTGEIKGRKLNVKKQAKKEESATAKEIRKLDRRTDDVLTFEQMGIDALFIDEAHNFKKIGFSTKMQNVKGVDTGYSERANSLYLKVSYVQERNGGRNVILATGTPITNTMAEVWTMMRFVAPEILEDYNIKTFDEFAATFGQVEPSLEQNSTGGFKIADRFKSYVNVPELVKAFRSHADVVLTGDVEEFQQGKNIPKLKDGHMTNHVIRKSEKLEEVMDVLVEALKEDEKKVGSDKRPGLPLVVFSKAKQAAIDLRLINPEYPDDPDSKTNKVVSEVMRIYRESTPDKGIQMIFCDSYQSPSSEPAIDLFGYDPNVPQFNLYRDIKQKLIEQGIPKEEIVIVSEISNAERKKAVFEKARKGDVRVLIGGTEKMGVGVNVQDRMIALHHMDAPIRPMDFEQRNGRILRQGNMFASMDKPVEVVTYGVEGTLDATAYERLRIKQDFINQMMKGDVSGRVMEERDDEDPSGKTFAQMAAELSGDKTLQLLFVAENEVKKLEGLRRSHEMKRQYGREELSSLNNKLLFMEEKELKEAEAIAREVAQDMPEGIVKLTANGKSFTEKLASSLAEIAGAYEEQYALNRGTLPVTIKFNSGLCEMVLHHELGQLVYSLYVGPYPIAENKAINTFSGIWLSVNSALSGAGKKPAVIKESIADVKKRIKGAESIIDKPFDKMDELKAAQQKVRELKEELAKKAKESEASRELKLAIRRDQVFYSNAERAIEQIKQEKATPQQWLAMIEKNGGMKAGEDKWIGLSDWLKESDKKSLTKQELLDYLEQNKIQVEDVEYIKGYNEQTEKYSNAIAAVIGAPVGKAQYGRYYGADGYNLSISGPREDVDATKRMLAEKYGVDANKVHTEVWKQVQDIQPPKEINHIRLRYTTKGLENHREIALTVPTIEPWKVSDKIHFGDAGRGRAIAWARFGDTMVDDSELAKVVSDAAKDVEEFLNTMTDKYKPGGGSVELSEYIGYMSKDEVERMHELFDAHLLAQINAGKNKKRVLVIDEIQSNRHQEGREKGYAENLSGYLKAIETARAESKKAEDEYNQYYDNLISSNPAEEYFGLNKEGVREKIDELSMNRDGALVRLHSLEREYKDKIEANKSKIPAAPFEKNWSELAMKRVLRYAAENGYDKVAWTTGEQQADRYNLSNVVERIQIKKFDDGYDVYSYAKGTGALIEHKTYSSEKELSDSYGQALAAELIKKDAANKTDNYVSVEGDGLKVGGEGMKGFYDKMLPSFVSKYVKKWGAKVQDIELPNVEEAGRLMHSVDITDAMKESVMQGQPLFAQERNKVVSLPEEMAGDSEESLDKMVTAMQPFESVAVNAPEMVIAQSTSDILKAMPGIGSLQFAAIVREASRPEVQAMYVPWTRQIILLPNKGTVKEMRDKRWHESLHFGIDMVIPKDDAGRLMMERAGSEVDQLSPELSAWVKDTYGDRNVAEEKVVHLVEEFISYLEDTGKVRSLLDGVDFGEQYPVLNDVVNKVINYLTNNGHGKESDNYRGYDEGSEPTYRGEGEEGRVEEDFAAVRNEQRIKEERIEIVFTPQEIAEMETPILRSKGGFKNLSEGEAWAKKNLQGKSEINRFTGEEISIGKKAIDEMFHPKFTKTVGEQEHLKALMSVLDFIREGIPGEIHADTHGRDFNVMRLFNAIEIDDEIYRVKSTVKKVKQGERYYTYELQEMELIEETPEALGLPRGTNHMPQLNSTNSITGAKLLKNVKKTNSDDEILSKKELEVKLALRGKPRRKQGETVVSFNRRLKEWQAEMDAAKKKREVENLDAVNPIDEELNELAMEMMNHPSPTRKRGESDADFKVRQAEWIEWYNTRLPEINARMSELKAELERQSSDARTREIDETEDPLYRGEVPPQKDDTGELTDDEMREVREIFQEKMKDAQISVSKDQIRRDIKQEIIERRRYIETSNLEDTFFVDQVKKSAGSKEVLRAIPDYIEGTYTGEVTPELVNTAKMVSDWFEEVYNLMAQEGVLYDAPKIQNYVTHIWDWKRSPKEAQERYNNWVNTMRLRSPYTKHRVIPSYKEGIAMGMVPKYEDITGILLEYGHYATETIANKRMLEFLKNFKVFVEGGKDNLPMEVDVIVPDKVKDPMYSRMNHTALDGYKVLNIVKPYITPVFGDQRIIDPSHLNPLTNKLIDGIWATSGLMKKIALSFSFFHHGALTETAVAMMKPWNTAKVIAKDLIWDVIMKGNIPALNKKEAARDAVKHLVSLGASNDYVTADVNALTTQLHRWTKDKHIPVAQQAAHLLDFLNKGSDKILWDTVHDGFKIASFEKMAKEVRAKAEREGWSQQQLDKVLDECGHLVNDTFGGLHFDILGFSPKSVRIMRALLLSPDWTLATIRQALSPLGFGKLYGDEGFWRTVFSGESPVKMRKKYGRDFWITAMIFFYALMNGLNAYFRVKDEEEMKQDADDMRRIDPDYKSPYELAYPNGMKWYDYTMPGNTLSHQTHLFTGRYDDGTERYARWGKQFRELPELFFGRDGFSFPGPMIDKLSGKANPLLSTVFEFVSGYSLSGWENAHMKDKKGWERDVARLYLLASKFVPYSVPTQEDKDFYWLDLLMPSSKGFSPGKAINYFEKAILSGDMNYVAGVYNACVINGLQPEKYFNAAKARIEAEVKAESLEDVETLQDATKKFDEATDVKERKRLLRYMEQQIGAQDYRAISQEEMLQQATELRNGEKPEVKSNDRYLELSTSVDVTEDYRMKMNAAGLKKYYQDYTGLAAEDPESAKRMYQEKRKYIEGYAVTTKYRSAINKLKKALTREGVDEDKIIKEIRKLRKEYFDTMDRMELK